PADTNLLTLPKLDERGRRLFAAAEVVAAGNGALAIVSKITGIARSTINRGADDLGEGPLPDGRIRRKGGGGKPLIESDPTQAKRQPVISVDTKKKELVGNYRNGGCDYRPKGDPRRVNMHDFEDKKLGKVVPNGVYDVTANAAVVSVGITADTAEFAVQAIRC